MPSLALYRKYRPRTFDEIVGQEHVTGPLIQALKNGKLHHAYLFSGPRGCGKTSSARILARSLNCEQGPTPTPCGVCASCVALAPNGPGSLDVLEIDAASHNGVDDARDLRERAFYAPVSSRFKIYVIDEAHMVTAAAFNALLKLVEEPPEFVKFVFATTEPEKVLQTIRSRTHHYPLRLMPPKEMRELLERLCGSEGVAVEPMVLPLVVRAGGGSARDSLSILDQLLSGAGPEGVSYDRAVSLLGVTDGALLDEMCDALAAADGAGVLGAVDRVVEAGHDPRRFGTDLLERLRDLLVLEKVPDAASKGLIDASPDQLERMTGQALRLGGASLSRMADVVHEGLVQMRGTTSPRLLLELVCARMMLPGADDSHAALLQRLERLERRWEISGTPSAAPVSAPPTESRRAEVRAEAPRQTRPRVDEPSVDEPRIDEPSVDEPSVDEPSVDGPGPDEPGSEPPGPDAASPSGRSASGRSQSSPSTADEPGSPPATAAASPQASPSVAPITPGPVSSASPGGLDAAAVRRVWPEIVASANAKKRQVGAYVREATVLSVDGTTLVLSFPHAFHAKALTSNPALGIFQQSLTDVLGVRWDVRCEVGPGGPDGGAEPAGWATPTSSSAGGPTSAGTPSGGGSNGTGSTPAGDQGSRATVVLPESVGAAATSARASSVGMASGSRAPEPADDGWPTVSPAGGMSVPTPVGARPAVAYEGFDPGDEPVDDDPGEGGRGGARGMESDAVALLQQTLGARKIGEHDAG